METNALCSNDILYRVNDDPKKSCRWMRFGPPDVRRNKYCISLETSLACPQTCGTCCEDDPSYKFKIENKKKKSCLWIAQKPSRQIKWCGDSDVENGVKTYQNGRMIRDACPVSCDLCFDPVEPQTFLPSNLGPFTFNPVGIPFCFDTYGDIEVDETKFSDLELTVEYKINYSETLTTSNFVFDMTDLSFCTVDVLTRSGLMSIALKGTDVSSGLNYKFETDLWAGNETAIVALLQDDGDSYVGNATVTAQSADNADVTSTEAVDSLGLATFNNLPSRTIIFQALSSDGNFGSTATVGGGDAFIYLLDAFNEASDIDNNDFSLGLDGWVIPDEAIHTLIVDHVENVGPSGSEDGVVMSKDKIRIHKNIDRKRGEGRILRPVTKMESEDLTDKDFVEDTAGIFDYKVTSSRTFVSAEGVNGVAVRYRFVTSEVPNGWFGSQYNDYFSISIRAQSSSKSNGETNSMNGLGLSAFDYSSGSTDWRQLKLALDADGDTIQVDVTVANVADGLFDSQVHVDFVEEMTQNLCIYSKVAEGIKMTKELQKEYKKKYPAFTTAGHAALMLVDTFTGDKTTWGLWPDNHETIVELNLDNEDGSDIREDFIGDVWSEAKFPFMYCEPITEKEKKKLLALTSINTAWTCTHNCASFASETFYDVTGIDIDADEFLGFETPREVGQNIIRENGGSFLPPGGLPWASLAAPEGEIASISTEAAYYFYDESEEEEKAFKNPVFPAGLVSSFTAAYWALCFP